jgi:hypothetical protein
MSPAGAGTPALATAQGGKVFLDPATNVQQPARQIDYQTGQYVINSQGRAGGMPTTKQLVVLAVKTFRGSSAFTRLGLDTSKIDRFTANFQRQISDAYTLALSDLVNAKLIRIVSIVAQQIDVNRGSVTVSWVDLTNLTEQQVTV